MQFQAIFPVDRGNEVRKKISEALMTIHSCFELESKGLFAVGAWLSNFGHT